MTAIDKAVKAGDTRRLAQLWAMTEHLPCGVPQGKVRFKPSDKDVARFIARWIAQRADRDVQASLKNVKEVREYDSRIAAFKYQPLPTREGEDTDSQESDHWETLAGLLESGHGVLPADMTGREYDYQGQDDGFVLESGPCPMRQGDWTPEAIGPWEHILVGPIFAEDGETIVGWGEIPDEMTGEPVVLGYEPLYDTAESLDDRRERWEAERDSHLELQDAWLGIELGFLGDLRRERARRFDVEVGIATSTSDKSTARRLYKTAWTRYRSSQLACIRAKSWANVWLTKRQWAFLEALYARIIGLEGTYNTAYGRRPLIARLRPSDKIVKAKASAALAHYQKHAKEDENEDGAELDKELRPVLKSLEDGGGVEYEVEPGVISRYY